MAVAVGLALTEHKTGRASASLYQGTFGLGRSFGVGLARNAASRVAMLLQSDKKQTDKRSSAFETWERVRRKRLGKREEGGLVRAAECTDILLLGFRTSC
uniref:Uncharacterized protein n=1 Tax=Vespula pensylvanica TaxID=30213 RepID=A0A834P5T8_VESPE|nr:hypothetical protein H0235_006036 [Vespula pensylvanica]